MSKFPTCADCQIAWEWLERPPLEPDGARICQNCREDRQEGLGRRWPTWHSRPKQPCEDCGVLRPVLHKHHLKPRALGGTDADGFVRVCARCHTKRHNGLWGLDVRLLPQTRAKQGAAMRRRWEDPAYQAARSASSRIVATENWKDADFRAKIAASRASSEAWNVTRNQKVSATRKERAKDPAWSAKYSEAQKRNWEDPVYRATVGKWTPERREKAAEARRKAWADPEYRAKQVAARTKP